MIGKPYLFYDGVYAVEVNHPGIGIVRYGEIKGTPAGHPGIQGPVKAGQIIGFVGKMNTVPQSMLHFELFSGEATGPLTVRGASAFSRRSDLQDPTAFLDGCTVEA
jgi:hypothetical protein